MPCHSCHVACCATVRYTLTINGFLLLLFTVYYYYYTITINGITINGTTERWFAHVLRPPLLPVPIPAME